jgi:hypothetical protein
MTNVVKLHDDQETIRRIEKYIEQPPENSRVFTITPAVAEYFLLNYNKENRPKKPVNIAKYADRMSSVNWRLTGDTIKFSDRKLLRDGQNRLMACVRSGQPFKTHVVFGIEDDAFYAIDQGKNRGGSDVLAIAGFKNVAHLTAAIRWAYLIDENKVKSRDSLAPDFTLRLARERYIDLPGYISRAAAVCRITAQPIGLVAACLYHFNKADSRRAADFETAWAGGAYGGRFSAIGKMQSEISKIMGENSGRIHDLKRAAMIVQAWNVFCDGRKGRASDFVWSVADDFPDIKGAVKS